MERKAAAGCAGYGGRCPVVAPNSLKQCLATDPNILRDNGVSDAPSFQELRDVSASQSEYRSQSDPIDFHLQRYSCEQLTRFMEGTRHLPCPFGHVTKFGQRLLDNRFCFRQQRLTDPFDRYVVGPSLQARIAQILAAIFS
ncbi:Uncharacterised protein [Burkholderia pseudomallei]|nr:Uncharacterised protein [Burkholderia pseudomallei]